MCGKKICIEHKKKTKTMNKKRRFSKKRKSMKDTKKSNFGSEPPRKRVVKESAGAGAGEQEDDDDVTFRIYVTFMNGGLSEFEVLPSTTVNEIKELIREQTGIDEFFITDMDGKKFTNLGNTLKQYSVSQNSILHIVVIPQTSLLDLTFWRDASRDVNMHVDRQHRDYDDVRVYRRFMITKYGKTFLVTHDISGKKYFANDNDLVVSDDETKMITSNDSAAFQGKEGTKEYQVWDISSNNVQEWLVKQRFQTEKTYASILFLPNLKKVIINNAVMYDLPQEEGTFQLPSELTNKKTFQWKFAVRNKKKLKCMSVCTDTTICHVRNYEHNPYRDYLVNAETNKYITLSKKFVCFFNLSTRALCTNAKNELFILNFQQMDDFDFDPEDHYQKIPYDEELQSAYRQDIVQGISPDDTYALFTRVDSRTLNDDIEGYEGERDNTIQIHDMKTKELNVLRVYAINVENLENSADNFLFSKSTQVLPTMYGADAVHYYNCHFTNQNNLLTLSKDQRKFFLLNTIFTAIENQE